MSTRGDALLLSALQARTYYRDRVRKQRTELEESEARLAEAERVWEELEQAEEEQDAPNIPGVARARVGSVT